METIVYRVAGWALNLASVLLLVSFGKLDLIIVLMPISLLLACCFSGSDHMRVEAGQQHGKGMA